MNSVNLTNRWSEDETELLKNSYGRATNLRLEELLPRRTRVAIYKKARALNLPSNKEIEFINRSQARARENGPGWRGGKKITAKGYVMVLDKSNPMADTAGYVMEHRLKMAEHIGRALRADEVVHHKNGIKADNRIENLQLMSSEEHTILHHTGKKRSKETCFNISKSKKGKRRDKNE